MCGIAGWVGQVSSDERIAQVRRMMQALARRGPDSEGLEAWNSAVLGHRRLSIFDLSDAGHQPMSSEDRSVSVVFNGAIYNFLALRSELEAGGSRFRSHTDTEVLVHGYRSWGIDGLTARLRGMFAFAIWDERCRKLFLVRDRLGVKPLLYARAEDGSLAFASTARALRSGGFARELDVDAVLEYLEFGYVPEPRSIYGGVAKLPAASIAEWEDGKLAVRTYWSPNAVCHDERISFGDAVEETERLLLDAVRVRLQADVPVAALLSGGIDSTLVCWAIRKLGGDVTAFTVGTPDDPLDETQDATRIARSIGLPHRVIKLTGTFDGSMTDLTAAFGEPFASASALGMLKVSRAVRDEATVLLTGDGGDDVFLGYPEHLHFLYSARLSFLASPLGMPAWRAIRRVFPTGGPLKRFRSFLDYSVGGLGAVASAHEGTPEYRAHGLLGERLESCDVARRNIPWTRASARNLLHEFLAYDRDLRFVGEYLQKVDGATMHHALEARSPFLDQDLWSFASSLPHAVRLRGGRSKAILRELALRRVGAHVARGKKRGFWIPVQRWLVEGWRRDVENVFRESVLCKEGWLREEALVKDFGRAVDCGSAPIRLWYVYVLESWLRSEMAAFP